MNKRDETLLKNAAKKAYLIAGAIMEAADEDLPNAKLSEKIERAAGWKNMGTDGDLSYDDRRKLRELAALAKKHGN